MIACPPAILLLLAPAAIADYPARVVGVSDGDTLTVLTADKGSRLGTDKIAR
ncbi:hypothetical protein [Singulisphaera sp. PoT]|uniref:hypothetical protein n=1 Tax=Singulisphaera sp. PoT TaxID=3411797 RepID=UPI003BF602F5